mmetsp:Transcript_21247/g.46227  ORF Transcript_21247/g.46227 Transcript_21247/m.46227 type:complete len:308 (+) Transcript_21247:367-1290(+)
MVLSRRKQPGYGVGWCQVRVSVLSPRRRPFPRPRSPFRRPRSPRQDQVVRRRTGATAGGERRDCLDRARHGPSRPHRGGESERATRSCGRTGGGVGGSSRRRRTPKGCGCGGLVGWSVRGEQGGERRRNTSRRRPQHPGPQDRRQDRRHSRGDTGGEDGAAVAQGQGRPSQDTRRQHRQGRPLRGGAVSPCFSRPIAACRGPRPPPLPPPAPPHTVQASTDARETMAPGASSRSLHGVQRAGCGERDRGGGQNHRPDRHDQTRRTLWHKGRQGRAGGATEEQEVGGGERCFGRGADQQGPRRGVQGP